MAIILDLPGCFEDCFAGLRFEVSLEPTPLKFKGKAAIANGEGLELWQGSSKKKKMVSSQDI
jgi:hypothetical protein